MSPSDSAALAVEVHPHSTTHWLATYYSMVATSAGRQADVTWVVHQCLLPLPADPLKPARWLEARSPDPDHHCYAGHQACAAQLAAGYATASAGYDTETTGAPEQSASLHDAQQLRDATVVVPVGQLSEWVLDDLEDEASDVCE